MTNDSQPSSRSKKKPLWWTIGAFLLVGLYSLIQPMIERKFGIDLPDLRQQSSSQVSSDRSEQSDQATADRGKRSRQETASAATEANSELKPIGGGDLQSPAGLRYNAGRHEHRLAHVLRHANDIPDRPGPHGVFDGDQDDIVALLDEAYLLAKAGGDRVNTEKEGVRTVHLVNMQREIGFLGGQTGRRQRNPRLEHVRLVLEGRNVITAYPDRS